MWNPTVDRRPSMQLTVTDHVHCNGSGDRPYMYRRLSGIGHDPEEFTAWQPSQGDRPMYEGPDMPTADLPEDHKAPEPQPVPLDTSRLHKIEGYEGVGYHAHTAPPPITPPKIDDIHLDQRPHSEDFTIVAHIEPKEARTALKNHVAQHCCWGKSAADKMHINKITPSSALHYTLETYTETRSTSWEHEPYRGGPVDGPINGVPPKPWDIHCNPTQTFHDEVHFLEVAHTASVTSCHGCGGCGWMRCHSCMGRGFKRCISCHGQGRIWKSDTHGHRHIQSCWHCHGTGRKRCLSCGGDGRGVCKTCQGYRQIKCFIKLKIEYFNHMVEHIAEHTDMPEHLVKNVGGEIVFNQTQPKVWGVSNYPEEEICSASQRLVEDELSHFHSKARVLMQRQILRAVPVSEVSYTWKNDSETERFWVYGKENACYVPDYPQKYCWGCTIL